MTIFRHTQVWHISLYSYTGFPPSLRNYGYIGASGVFMCIFGDLVVVEASAGLLLSHS